MTEVIRVESRESSARVSSYRDLVAWKKSMDLLVAVYALTESFPKNEQFGLTSQIKRAVVSIPSNIAEGSSRRSTQEFLRYINIATGSLAEVETQLCATQRLNFITLIQEETLLDQCGEVSRIFQGLYNSLKSRLSTRLSTLDSEH